MGGGARPADPWPHEETRHVADLLAANRLSEVETLLRNALSKDSAPAGAWRNLGVLRGFLGHWSEAVGLLRQAQRRAPGDPTIWSDLGKALLHAGRVRTSVKVLEEARAKFPEYPEIRLRLAKSLIRARETPRALLECEACGMYLPALRLRGRQLSLTGRHHEALVVWRQALSAGASEREDLALHAALEWHCGYTKRSLEIARALIDTGPVPPMFWSMYISGRLHGPDETIAEARRVLEEWSGTHSPEENAVRAPLTMPRRGSRARGKLRIGYVTPEFQGGPAIHFVLPLLEHRDATRFEVTGYHCNPRRDAWARRAAAASDHWREISTEAGLEAAVRRDRIDILVDLSGHYGAMLGFFNRRHAPVQISFPNYPGSTGARCMDYILTDRWVCPEGNEAQYTEAPVWLRSGYLPYRPPLRPALQDPPSRTNRFITFGLFQRPSKMNESVWDVVAETMRRTPQSRLLMHYFAAELDDHDSLARRHFTSELDRRGISPSRVQFRGPARIEDHLALLANVDIALDTFPYNGQTTTCECIWMGVPAVTLSGALHVARVGWQIMDRTGHGELVSTSADEYVTKAVELAEDPPRLMRYRRELRRAMQQSPLMDGSVIRDIEAAYEGVFENA